MILKKNKMKQLHPLLVTTSAVLKGLILAQRCELSSTKGSMEPEVEEAVQALEEDRDVLGTLTQPRAVNDPSGPQHLSTSNN